MLEQLLHRLKSRQAEISLSLAQGHAITFEAYQRMVGSYEGITYALDQIDAILSEDDE